MRAISATTPRWGRSPRGSTRRRPSRLGALGEHLKQVLHVVNRPDLWRPRGRRPSRVRTVQDVPRIATFGRSRWRRPVRARVRHLEATGATFRHVQVDERLHRGATLADRRPPPGDAVMPWGPSLRSRSRRMRYERSSGRRATRGCRACRRARPATGGRLRRGNRGRSGVPAPGVPRAGGSAQVRPVMPSMSRVRSATAPRGAGAVPVGVGDGDREVVVAGPNWGADRRAMRRGPR